MRLGQLIKDLESFPKNSIVKYGFEYPHSYRGFYDQLAFVPAENVPVEKMIEDAKSALDKVFHGYKGGEYKIDEFTEVWLADYGCCGDGFSEMLLKYMRESITE